MIEPIPSRLMEYRNTPRQDGMSPAMILFGRAMRTPLPTHPVVYSPMVQKKVKAADRKAVEL